MSLSTWVYGGVLAAWSAAAVYLVRCHPGVVTVAAMGAAGAALAAVASVVVAVAFDMHALFGPLALLAQAVFVHTPLYLGGAAWVLSRRRRGTAVVCAAAGVLAAGVGAWSFFVEPQWLRVERYRVVSEKLEAPLRIAVLADIQTDDPGPHERRALELALAASPDLILLPGDYVHTLAEEDRPRLRARLRQLFADVGLEAPLGVWAVRGNVDSPDWRECFEGLPVVAVDETQSFAVGDVQLTCLSMRDSGRDDLGARGHAIARTGRFHLVLGHRPGFALGGIDADLLIAGHTHGGQVRLPFVGPLVTLSKIPRAWASGLTQIAPGQALLIPRGIGMERGHAPRLRFNCRPEVAIVDVVPLRDASRSEVPRSEVPRKGASIADARQRDR